MPTNILLVDDDHTILQPLKELLEGEELPFSVDTASDLSTADRLFRERVYDLLVVDIRMGRESGVDFVTTVRQSNPLIPIIMLSGAGGEADTKALASRQQSASTYLVKPFNGGKLIEWINKLLQQRDARYPELVALRNKAEHNPHHPMFIEQGRSVTAAELYNEVRRFSVFGMNFLSPAMGGGEFATLDDQPHDNAPPRVLYVDDDVILLMGAKEALKYANIAVETAYDLTTARAAWSRACQGESPPFDVLVVDVILGGGVSILPFIKEVRERSPWIPIIVLSGMAKQDDIIELMQDGIVDYRINLPQVRL